MKEFRYLTDYHMHTTFSDGSNTHIQMAAVASAKGLKEIGFTDHICLKNPPWSAKVEDLSVIFSVIQQLRNQFSMPIRFGAEIDYLPGYEDQIRQLIANHPLDYVIGSVHYIADWTFDSEKYIPEFSKWKIDDLYKKYFQLIRQAATSKLFDTIGHCDIIKKFGHRPVSNLTPVYEETVQAFQEAGVCMELNTSGLDKTCNEMYPSTFFVKLCAQKQVPITLGSDAHTILEISRYFPEAVDLLRNAGITHLTAFNARSRNMIPLPEVLTASDQVAIPTEES